MDFQFLICNRQLSYWLLFIIQWLDLIAPCVFKTTDNGYTCSLLLEGITLFGVKLVITTEDHIESLSFAGLSSLTSLDLSVNEQWMQQFHRH